MFEIYIKAARRVKATTEELCNLYRSHYDILSQVFGQERLPSLEIIYSIQRRCEFIRLSGQDIIVYDQYLGQSMNQLNRALLANIDQGRISKAFACKFIAERMTGYGCIALAQFFALCHQSFLGNLENGLKPINMESAQQDFRLQLTTVQELFALSHELGHHLTLVNENEVKGHIKDLIERFFQFKNEKDEGYYRSIFQSHETELISEISADYVSALACVRICTHFHKISYNIIVLGIVLALRYLRLFRHLELLCDFLSGIEDALTQVEFSQKQKQIFDAVWADDEGRIQFQQFREHLIRFSLTENFASRPNSEEEVNVSEFIVLYEEYIEGPIIFSFLDVLVERLEFDTIHSLKTFPRGKREALRMIDLMTGWQRSRTSVMQL